MRVLTPILAVCLSVLILFACSKDKFETKPRLEIKDFTSEVQPGGAMRVTLQYFDKEGDLGEALIVGEKIRLNMFPPVPEQQFKADSFGRRLPEFADRTQGEIAFDLPYDLLDESLVFNDSVQFTFYVVDKAGNTSDTITSDLIVARQQ